jgi:hypothetical protein
MCLFMLRRWAHNSTYTNVSNPHNHIDDIPLAAGILVVVDGVLEVYLRYYDRSLPQWL